MLTVVFPPFGVCGTAANIVGMFMGRKASKVGDSTGKLGFWLNLAVLLIGIIGFIVLMIFVILIFAAAGSNINEYNSQFSELSREF